MTTAQTAGTGKILVGIDGSDSSIQALQWAARQAVLTTSSLDVIMTWDLPSSYGWAMPFPDGYDPEESIRTLLTDTVAELRKEFLDVVVTTRVLRGHPAPILVEASKDADLLVVGSRGHGEFTGMLIGSVSEHCAAHAHCPVLVHRPGT
jgi:nucleotide-binding universal stress UspA family protein